MNNLIKLFRSIILLFPIILVGCLAKDKSLDIYSYEIDNPSQKRNTLIKHIHPKDTGFIDAEYHIWFKDNKTGLVPGPSDFRIKYALKIPSDSLNFWINYLEPSSEKLNIKQWQELKLNGEKWSLNSSPELYHSSLKTEVKLLFRSENIILGIHSSMPIILNK